MWLLHDDNVYFKINQDIDYGTKFSREFFKHFRTAVLIHRMDAWDTAFFFLARQYIKYCIELDFNSTLLRLCNRSFYLQKTIWSLF